MRFCECNSKMALWYGWDVLMGGEWCYFCDILLSVWTHARVTLIV